MNLRQLEILCAVIRCETTLSAAQELGISQPAISNAIKQIEKQLGFSLFERVNHRLRPTEAAWAIYRGAEPIFLTHSALESRIQDIKAKQIGEVRILATPALGYTIVPIAMKRFLVAVPQTRALFDIRRLEMVCHSIENQAVDLGLAFQPYKHSTLEIEPIFQGEMVCIFRRDHPFTAREVITPKDLQGVPIISLERGTKLDQLVRRSFEAAEQPFRFVVEVRHCNTACVLAESGVGVAIVDPLSPICAGSNELEIRPFSPAATVTAHILRSRIRPLSDPAAAFLDQLRAVGQEMAEPFAPSVTAKRVTKLANLVLLKQKIQQLREARTNLLASPIEERGRLSQSLTSRSGRSLRR
jgi:DNA-binding transcriptional LysR family regulator